VLVGALTEGLREFRGYIRSFPPDEERGLPWGTGNREDYLDAMHRLRSHIVNVLWQVARLLGDRDLMAAITTRRESWIEDAYDASAGTRSVRGTPAA
jgi:hypothetical protein